MTLDLDFVRSQFPAFREPSLSGFAHFENAGGSYAAGQTIDWLERYYRQTRVQPYYVFPASARAGEQMDSAKTRLAAWLNAGTDELHFGPSTSQNTFVLAQALRRRLKSGDEVIVTNQDHEANVGAYARLADDGITVREWKVNPATAELERQRPRGAARPAHEARRLHALLKRRRQHQRGARVRRPRPPRRRPGLRGRCRLLAARPAGRPRTRRRRLLFLPI